MEDKLFIGKIGLTEYLQEKIDFEKLLKEFNTEEYSDCYISNFFLEKVKVHSKYYYNRVYVIYNLEKINYLDNDLKNSDFYKDLLFKFKNYIYKLYLEDKTQVILSNINILESYKKYLNTKHRNYKFSNCIYYILKDLYISERYKRYDLYECFIKNSIEQLIDLEIYCNDSLNEYLELISYNLQIDFSGIDIYIFNFVNSYNILKDKICREHLYRLDFENLLKQVKFKLKKHIMHIISEELEEKIEYKRLISSYISDIIISKNIEIIDKKIEDTIENYFNK